MKKQGMKPKTLQAFTLLELLVALAIFAIIAIMAYAGLNTILTARQQTEQHAAQLAQLQITFLWLGRDIEQLVERAIRDQYGDRQAILQGKNSNLELTRAGWRNPARQKRSSLQRVAYFLEDKILYRSYWWVLDRAQDTSPIKMDLLNNVNAFKLRYLDKLLKWHEQWPPLNFIPSQAENVPPISKLRAIEVTLTVEGWGDIIRLFRTP